MKIWIDGSLTRTCIYPEGGFPCVVPFSGTTNQAEYEAMLRAVEYIEDQTDQQEFLILSDSQLLVRQLNGQYAIKNAELERRATEIWGKLTDLRRQGKSISIEWLSREENKAGVVLG